MSFDSEGFRLRHLVSRRCFLAAFIALSCAGMKSAFAASLKAADFDDPFLGQTTQGDLILAPQKTLAAGMFPARSEFFGIVRKTNVVPNDQDMGKINLLALYAAFSDGECRVSLCTLETLAGSSAITARRAYDALTAVAERLKDRPDAVYAIQDVDELARVSCAKSGSRSVIVLQKPRVSALLAG
jgi:hypothetical protein